MNDKKLKPIPPEFQDLSNAMMVLHQSTENAANDALTALEYAKKAIPVMVSETNGKFLIADAGETMRRLAILYSVQYESRAIHALMSDALQKHGFELPVIQIRGPGGGR